MKRVLCFTWFVLLSCSVINAEDFVVYDNPFSVGDASCPEVGTDGTLWFRSSPSCVVGLEPSTGLCQRHRFRAGSMQSGPALDTEGGIWVSSDTSIFRIHQGIVTSYDLGLAILAVAASPDGSVWCSTPDPWLWRFESGGWAPVEGCPEKYVGQICFEADGTGWFAFTKGGEGGLVRYRDGQWTFFARPGVFPSWWDMAVGLAGEVWLTDGCAVHQFQDGNSVAVYGKDDGLASWGASYVDIDTQGRVWVGDYTSGVSMFDRQSWTVFNTLNSGLPCNMVKGVAASCKGPVFICTIDGLASYDAGLWNCYRGETVCNTDVWSVAVNDQDVLCYGTQYGQVGRRDSTAWDMLHSPGGLGFNPVYDIAFDGTGGVWFGCYHNLMLWKGSVLTYPMRRVSQICVDHESNVWVCSPEAGLARYDGQTWTNFGPSDPPIIPLGIACDLENRIWVGTGQGVAVIDNDQLVDWLPQYQNVTAITCDRDGKLWFGFEDSGVLEFDGENEVAWFTVDDGLPSNEIVCLECDVANNIWVGTNDGLGYFDRNAWTKWDIDSGLPVNEIRDIFAAPNGDVWFATPAGLLCRESGIEPPGPTITNTTDGDVYRAGDTMTVTLTYENPGPDVFIDIQVACQLPDGTLFYFPGGDTPVPFISGMLPSGTTIPMVIVLIYDFPTDFPTGQYTWMTAMFQQGTFNMITDIATAPFTFE